MDRSSRPRCESPRVRMPLPIASAGDEPCSYHPGGAQFAFFDGSVHFISTSIDDVNLEPTSRLNDGQPVGETGSRGTRGGHHRHRVVRRAAVVRGEHTVEA